MSDAIKINIPGDAVAFARAGSRGKFRYTPKRQADFMTVVKAFAAEAMNGRPPLDGPVSMAVSVTYLPPASWSEKKKSRSVWKASRPDADNISKILADAMNKIVFVDDAQICELIVRKQYGPLCGTQITINPL